MSSHSRLWVIWELGGLGLLPGSSLGGAVGSAGWRRYQGLWVATVRLVVTQSACTCVMRITLSFYITCIYLCVCLQVSCNTKNTHMCDACQHAMWENHTVLLHCIYLFVCVSACCWPACTHSVSMRSEKKKKTLQESALSFYHGGIRQATDLTQVVRSG